ncbi:MAG: hypothetical protein IKD08_00770, partial [Alphaproteobacteria bacterium]|nr:hypothetical protein [Alphaproteobacteria bacterium]
INRSCAGVIASWTSAPTGWYNITTSSSATSTPCVFTGNRVATNAEVITQCNSNGGASVQCRYGWNNNLNRSCERVIASNTSAASGWYQITTSSSSASQLCFFVGSRLGTAAESVAQCNGATTSSAMASSVACRYAYLYGYNTSCTAVVNNYPSGNGKINSLTNASGGWRECCNCVSCANIGYVSGGECKDVNGWGWVSSTQAKTYFAAQTFCNNLGMAMKSAAQLQADGLWNTGSNPFSIAYWHWPTDVCWTCGCSGTDCGHLVRLGSKIITWGGRAGSKHGSNSIGWTWSYALCGPK